MKIMGILNVTPDSFFDGGAYLAPEKAIARAFEIEGEGADILDVGGQSTRPGCEVIAPGEEWRRLRPVLEGLRGQLKIPVSIDTFYPEVAEKALALGAGIVNDVSGRVTQEMAGAVKAHGAVWVLMYAGGFGAVREVHDALLRMAHEAMALGIDKERIWLDPGFGFGKGREENWRLLANLREAKPAGFTLLAGVSRKRMTGGTREGTLAAQTLAQWEGADVVRAHNVSEARQVVNFTNNILRFHIDNSCKPCIIERPRMDRIHITGLALHAYHGVNPEEREQGQAFLLDILLEADVSKARQSDDLADTVNYARAVKAAAAAFTGQACNLIERAAEITARAVLAECPAAQAVTLRVHKPDAPIKATVGDIAIEITINRKGDGDRL